MRYGLIRVSRLFNGFSLGLNPRTFSCVSLPTCVSSTNSITRSQHHDSRNSIGNDNPYLISRQILNRLHHGFPSSFASTSFTSTSFAPTSFTSTSFTSTSFAPRSFSSTSSTSFSSFTLHSNWLPQPISLSASHRPYQVSIQLFSLPVRHLSSHRLSPNDRDKDAAVSGKDKDNDKDENNNSLSSGKKGLVHRFHKAYKNYGTVLIGFHCVTYCIYFTSFMGISYAGLDVVLFLEWLRDHVGLPQAIISKITTSGAGHVAVAFILCKVISPIRYLTTMVGTKYTADYLRRRGYMAPVPEGDRLGELAKESQKLIESKSAEIKTQFSRGRRRFSKVNEVRIRKTNKTVGDWRAKMRLRRGTPKK